MAGGPQSSPSTTEKLERLFFKLTSSGTWSVVEGGVIEERKRTLLHFLGQIGEFRKGMADYIKRHTTIVAVGGGGHEKYKYRPQGQEDPIEAKYKDLFAKNLADTGPCLIKLPYRKVMYLEAIGRMLEEEEVKKCIGLWPAFGVETERWNEVFPPEGDEQRSEKLDKMKVLFEKKAYLLVRKLVADESFKLNFINMVQMASLFKQKYWGRSFGDEDDDTKKEKEERAKAATTIIKFMRLAHANLRMGMFKELIDLHARGTHADCKSKEKNMEFAEKWSSDKKFGFVSSFVRAAQEGTFQSLELPVPIALAFRQTITFRGRTWFKYHRGMAAELVERFSEEGEAMDEAQARKAIRWMRAVKENNEEEVWPQLIKEVLKRKKGRNEDEVNRLYESVKGVEVYIGLYHVLRNGLGVDEEEEEEEEEEEIVQNEALEGDEDSMKSASNSDRENEDEQEEDGRILDFKGLEKALRVGRKAITRPQVKEALREQEGRALNHILDLNEEIFIKTLTKEGQGVLQQFFELKEQEEEEESMEEDMEENITGGVEERKQGEQGEQGENNNNIDNNNSKRKSMENAYLTPEQGGAHQKRSSARLARGSA